MRKTFLMTAAAFALSAQAVAAAPIGAGATVGERSHNPTSEDRRGIISMVLDQIGYSISAIVGVKAGGPKEEEKERHFLMGGECTEGDDHGEEELAEGEANPEEPVGPEPIYFGF